jgi:hypothetical protein
MQRSMTICRLALWAISFLPSALGWAQEGTSSRPPLAILLAAGDIAKCTKKGVDEATAKVLEREIEATKKAGVRTYVLALGDLAYDGGTTDNFKCLGGELG